MREAGANATDPRVLVVENDDLWSAVLKQLCTRQLCLATATCRSHRALQLALLSERDALFVTFGPCGRNLTRHIALTERYRDTGGGGLPPRCGRWKSNGEASDWLRVPPPPQFLIVDSRLLHLPTLPLYHHFLTNARHSGACA